MLRVTFFYFTLCVSVHAQTIDFSGEWAGTAQWLATSMQLEYQLTQKGLVLEGYSLVKSLDGRDSSKAKVKGVIRGNKVRLHATKFVYKVGSGCLSISELVYEKGNDEEKLKGRWRGDMKFSTCPPGISGKVDLIHILPEAPVLASSRTMEQPSAMAVHGDDFEGNELIKELRQREYYALVIAISEYSDPSIQSLDNPITDARSLAQILGSHYTFEKENITLLENPNRAEIIESFDDLTTRLTARDQLVVFYAGHGIWDAQLNQGFWLPADATTKSKAQWLSNSTIRDYIGGIRSKHTLLITDACFSGGIFKERAVFSNSRAMLEMYKLPSRKAMTSGALKTVPDKSVFIQYLNKNLINNAQPLLSAEELFNRFKVAVINNSANGQVPQYGPIGQAGDEGGDFIFLKRME
jgi:hypothetical protein